MILLIDNYDSFTYNLYQYLGELGEQTAVVRNDRISLKEIEEMGPQGIVLSPGPGRPEAAGICIGAVQRFAGDIPILGICLGHQAIAAAFGGRIIRAQKVMHGKISAVTHTGKGLFGGMEPCLEVMRYHSLSAEKSTLPEEFEIDALTEEDGEIMAIRHKRHPLYGLQFHPESIGTKAGKRLLGSFIKKMKGRDCVETVS